MIERRASQTNSSSVQSLIQLGFCQPADIRRAIIDAEKLSSPEFSGKIRNVERKLKMVGDSNRIRILLLLAKREMCVCELEAALKLPQPTISHHLGLLEKADLLLRTKKGKFVFYQMNSESPVFEFLKNMIRER